MKTCPNCHQSHIDDDLSFCTACGTPLPSVSQRGADYDPMKTAVLPNAPDTNPPSPFGTNPPQHGQPFSEQPKQQPLSEQPTVNRPFAEPPPHGWQSDPQTPFQPLFAQPPSVQNYGQSSQPDWSPPPPPVQGWGNNPNAANLAYSQAPQQTMAMVSLITGVFSVTLGFCCSMGLLTGPVAIVTGIIALVQIKNNPKLYTGKGLAFGGIATGIAYIIIWVLLIMLNVGLSILPVLLDQR